MEISLSSQFVVFFGACLCGGVLGVLWDLHRFLRLLLGILSSPTPATSARVLPLIGRVSPTISPKGKAVGAVLTAVGDILFFLVAAVLFRLYLFLAAEGTFRWFSLCGGILGFLLHFCTLGRLFLRFGGWFSFWVRVAFRYLAFFLGFPFRLLGRGVRRLWNGALYWHLRRAYMRKMKREAEKGFRVEG